MSSRYSRLGPGAAQSDGYRRPTATAHSLDPPPGSRIPSERSQRKQGGDPGGLRPVLDRGNPWSCARRLDRSRRSAAPECPQLHRGGSPRVTKCARRPAERARLAIAPLMLPCAVGEALRRHVPTDSIRGPSRPRRRVRERAKLGLRRGIYPARLYPGLSAPTLRGPAAGVLHAPLPAPVQRRAPSTGTCSSQAKGPSAPALTGHGTLARTQRRDGACG